MFWLKQIVIGDGERGLLYRNRRFERVLSPGVHRLFDPRKRIAVTAHNLTRPEYAGSDAEVLMAQMDECVFGIFCCIPDGLYIFLTQDTSALIVPLRLMG